MIGILDTCSEFACLGEAGFTQIDIMLGPGTIEAFKAMAPVLELLRAT